MHHTLSNLSPEPKNGVAYKKKCVQIWLALSLFTISWNFDVQVYNQNLEQLVEFHLADNLWHENFGVQSSLKICYKIQRKVLFHFNDEIKMLRKIVLKMYQKNFYFYLATLINLGFKFRQVDLNHITVRIKKITSKTIHKTIESIVHTCKFFDTHCIDTVVI